jgi:hypothetical protein
VQGDMLRPLAMRQAHEFTEPGLGVLKAPPTARRLRRRACRIVTLTGSARFRLQDNTTGLLERGVTRRPGPALEPLPAWP